MKNLKILILSFVLVPFSIMAQDGSSAKSGAVIAWENQTFDFGDIYQGDKVEHTFTLINQGTEPLVITNVQVTCGCTTPKGWPRDPIAPGEKAEITVAFNSAGKFGRQNKVVTLVSNSVSGSNQITFSANVLEKKIPE